MRCCDRSGASCFQALRLTPREQAVREHGQAAEQAQQRKQGEDEA
ncbi:MAG TPA: hypothetical protein VFH22_05520 [Rhodocyclaceae bacterium]|nr:hypothetical protein [Rhodocyclaceae bacterium]